MKIAKIILGSFLGFIGLFLLVFGFPIFNVTEDGCRKVSAFVYGVNAHEKSKDISITLKGDDARYYINRGLESGLTEEGLREAIMNQEATVLYAKHWSLLNFKSKVRHIAKIVVADKVIYSEIKS